MKKLSLMEVLEGIEDTRRERSVWYPLEEVLFITSAGKDRKAKDEGRNRKRQRDDAVICA